MIEICLKCGSDNTRIENKAGLMAGFHPNSISNDCGFSAMLFPQVKSEEVNKFKAAIKTKPVIQEKKE